MQIRQSNPNQIQQPAGQHDSDDSVEERDDLSEKEEDPQENSHINVNQQELDPIQQMLMASPDKHSFIESENHSEKEHEIIMDDDCDGEENAINSDNEGENHQ